MMQLTYNCSWPGVGCKLVTYKLILKANIKNAKNNKNKYKSHNFLSCWNRKPIMLRLNEPLVVIGFILTKFLLNTSFTTYLETRLIERTTDKKDRQTVSQRLLYTVYKRFTVNNKESFLVRRTEIVTLRYCSVACVRFDRLLLNESRPSWIS